MTAKRTDPHKVAVEFTIYAAGTPRERTAYQWVCTRGCKGRPSSREGDVTARGRRHEQRRIGRTKRG